MNIYALIAIIVLVIAVPTVIITKQQLQPPQQIPTNSTAKDTTTTKTTTTNNEITFKLSPNPDSLSKKVGDIFKVAVSIDAGTNIIDKAALKLEYDANRLRLKSFNNATGANSFELVLRPSTPTNPTSTPGTFDYEGGTLSEKMSGIVNLGVLEFTVIGAVPTSETPTTLIFTSNSLYAGKPEGGNRTTSGEALILQIFSTPN